MTNPTPTEPPTVKGKPAYLMESDTYPGKHLIVSPGSYWHLTKDREWSAAPVEASAYFDSEAEARQFLEKCCDRTAASGEQERYAQVAAAVSAGVALPDSSRVPKLGQVDFPGNTYHGHWYVVDDHPPYMIHLRKDGRWGNGTDGENGYWPTREEAEAAIAYWRSLAAPPLREVPTLDLPDAPGHWMREEGRWDVLVKHALAVGFRDDDGDECTTVAVVADLPLGGWTRVSPPAAPPAGSEEIERLRERLKYDTQAYQNTLACIDHFLERSGGTMGVSNRGEVIERLIADRDSLKVSLADSEAARCEAEQQRDSIKNRFDNTFILYGEATDRADKAESRLSAAEQAVAAMRKEAERLIRMTAELASNRHGGDGPNHHALAVEVHLGLSEALAQPQEERRDA